jgi:hypothetical protein
VSRGPARWKWPAVSAGVLTLLIPLAGGMWCALHWDRTCFEWQAFLYRNSPRDGDLYEIDRYLEGHWQGMTEHEVVGFLGRPTFAIDGADQSNDWADIPRWMKELDLSPDGTERVLWYDYCKHGDLHVGDETYNIYFFIRDGKVLKYATLFP